MDDEVFRGTAVLETVAEVDLDASDPADALNSRQFRFAFLQRAMRPVAFARDLLQVLPQPFGGVSFRQNVRRCGRRRTSGNLCPALSHIRRQFCESHLVIWSFALRRTAL